jgi:hypothetical protein
MKDRKEVQELQRKSTKPRRIEEVIGLCDFRKKA